MDILNHLNEEYEIVLSEPASTEEEIQKLIEFSEIEVPEEYLSIIRQKSDLTIFVKNCEYERNIYIMGADMCFDMNQAYEIQKWIPNSLVIGHGEGGELLLYATGSNGFGVYTVGCGDLDIEDAIYLVRLAAHVSNG